MITEENDGHTPKHINLVYDNRPLTINDLKVVINESQKEMEARFNARFDKIDAKFEKVEDRLTKLEVAQEKIFSILWYHNLIGTGVIATLLWLIKCLYASGVKLLP